MTACDWLRSWTEEGRVVAVHCLNFSDIKIINQELLESAVPLFQWICNDLKYPMKKGRTNHGSDSVPGNEGQKNCCS